MSTGGAPDAGGGSVKVPTPKTRLTTSYGRVTKSLSKTAPDNLARARLARQRINKLFYVPTRKGNRGR